MRIDLQVVFGQNLFDVLAYLTCQSFFPTFFLISLIFSLILFLCSFFFLSYHHHIFNFMYLSFFFSAFCRLSLLRLLTLLETIFILDFAFVPIRHYLHYSLSFLEIVKYLYLVEHQIFNHHYVEIQMGLKKRRNNFLIISSLFAFSI